jgi:branched-chain amino acid transport system substrate-binding protein
LIPTVGTVSLMLLAACGTSTTTGGGGASSGGGLASCSGTVTVASDLPTSGGDASIGGGTQNGVELAVKHAMDTKLLGGCTINYIKKDDASVAKGKHDPQQGAQNVTALANNAAVVGVVGPFNSSVAVAELPISNQAGLAQISPSNTDPGLTIVGSDPDINTNSLRPTGNITYFRVITNDSIQGADEAQVATAELGSKKAYIIDDQETYGKDLANYFESNYKKDGGAVLKHVSLPGDTKDFKAQLTEAKGLGADLLFFGGTASNGSGIIKTQMADVGATYKYLSGDGTVDPQYFKDAGANGAGGYATSAPDTTKVSAGASFPQAYGAVYPASSLVVYSTYGYDAMDILLNAVKAVLVDNGGKIPTDSTAFRSSVITKIKATKHDGYIGHTEFDSNGDTLNHNFGLYKATASDWVQQEVIQAKS